MLFSLAVFIEDINIRIYKGEFVFIVGSSGSGKSTLIRLMLKEILPLASSVVLTKPAHDERAQHWMQIESHIHAIAPHCPCRIYDNDRSGLQQEVEGLQTGQLLCITGSLYLISDCRSYLLRELL